MDCILMHSIYVVITSAGEIFRASEIPNIKLPRANPHPTIHFAESTPPVTRSSLEDSACP